MPYAVDARRKVGLKRSVASDDTARYDALHVRFAYTARVLPTPTPESAPPAAPVDQTPQFTG
jgi:hypothetical protein